MIIQLRQLQHTNEQLLPHMGHTFVKHIKILSTCVFAWPKLDGANATSIPPTCSDPKSLFLLKDVSTYSQKLSATIVITLLSSQP
ncbi:unnamed protein product, partial [Vitis vinifera]|uniref:Uncharacterized protein n=1 Tax=Vitis vinifera TaxID=29760 RepID=D7SVR6_VITVI